MGHSEPASGLCSLAKVIIAMEKGKIPANLHYKNPNPNIPSLSDGRIKVYKYNLNKKYVFRHISNTVFFLDKVLAYIHFVEYMEPSILSFHVW